MSSAYWTHGSVFVNVFFLVGNEEACCVIYRALCLINTKAPFLFNYLGFFVAPLWSY